jgi:hypothetical protein
MGRTIPGSRIENPAADGHEFTDSQVACFRGGGFYIYFIMSKLRGRSRFHSQNRGKIIGVGGVVDEAIVLMEFEL